MALVTHYQPPREYDPTVYPINIIFDNDFTRDADGVLAYTQLLALQAEGKCKILAVIGGEDDHLLEGVADLARTQAAMLDYFRQWYKQPSVPIGLPYADAEDTWKTLKTTRASEVFLPDAASQDSTDVYGNALAAAADKSVTIMTTGQLVALARFMATAEGETPTRWGGKTAIELIRDKVLIWACGAGVYPGGTPNINVTNFGCPWSADPAVRAACRKAARYVLANWPVETEIRYYGENITYGAFIFDPRILPASHPVCTKPYAFTGTCEAHDVARLHLHTDGLGGMYTLSASGYCTITEDGAQSWTFDEVDGTPTAGHPLARYVSDPVSNTDVMIWLAYKSKLYPPPRPLGVALAPDWSVGTYNTEMSGEPNAVLDTSGNNYHMTAYGTTKPKYLRDGIITFPAGSYIERLNGPTITEDNQPLCMTNTQWFVVFDVYIPDASVTDDLIFVGQSHHAGTNLENWSIGIVNKKWRFRRINTTATTTAELLSTADITAGWHRVCCAQRLTPAGRLVQSMYVDGVPVAEDILATVQSYARGRLRINGASWPGAVAANYPIGMFRLYTYTPINSHELISRWSDIEPWIGPQDVKYGVDRGDGLTGKLKYR